MKGRRVAIVGIGTTARPGNDRPRQSLKDMIVEGVYDAFSECKIDPLQIEAAAFAYHGEAISEHGGIAPVIADALGICPAPVFMTSSNCTGSSVALNMAHSMIAAGRYDIMLVGGFEKMTDHMSYGEYLNSSTDTDWDFALGFMHADGIGHMTNTYLRKYGYPTMTLTRWGYEMHKYGRMYDRSSTFGKPMPTMEQLHASPAFGTMLAWGEACSAVVICAEAIAHKFTDKPVFIDGVAYTTQPHYYGGEYDSYKGMHCTMPESYDCSYPGAMLAASEQAYKMAGITEKDVDVAQVYDIMIMGFHQLEGLRICKIGQAGRFVEEGGIALGGACPTNTDGGNIARGHASGHDGVAMVLELTRQLRGEAGVRQVNNARIGVAANIGGAAAHNTVIVMRNE
jgi:2-acetylphloroglucinol acetyltransferase